MTKAVYAGTFDPLTFGHLDIIKRASGVFDDLVVAATDNPGKAPMFSLDERLAMIEGILGTDTRISVQTFSGLLVDFIRKVGARVVVRGLRAASDFDYEFEMATMNRTLDKDMETVFFVSSPEFMFVSSSLIREIAQAGGDITPYVPTGVRDAIMSKLGES